MKIYWSFKDIPELADLTEDQQKTAFQQCYEKYLFKMRETWVACAIMSTLVTIGMHVFGPILGAAIGGAIGGGILSMIITNALRPHLKNYVSHHFAE
ncbi:hypothetical protein IQ266_10215 [filamentous cyanobacterium LEGE 11480]|uniref:Uncharacterized protein n=1 Tax=Romeriopsis navalis LEGE 11480 TaxID=2777977 RepID=A0A928VM06_9CYAN|nr:hypothetical protein [Romeriopsis navalis]MBE9030102.1 hypothetical protein [Romeriopsis navalis LEGE 11480]